ncbi:MAG: epoxide hydrolase family protein [Planctomycetota bacterium]
MSKKNGRVGINRREFMKASATAVAGAANLAQFGKARAEEQPESIEPFSIKIPEILLNDLSERLTRTRFPDQIENAGWSYGTELSYLKKLCAYWRSGFDWRAQEHTLNRFAHFRTEIDSLRIHFIHQRSKEKDAIPLIITHGWPGSFMEFIKIIGPLTNPIAHGGHPEDAFHVICPSIPGYGFSEAPRKSGFGCEQVAETFAKLIARLGYTQYGAQGGDWGAVISTWLAAIDATHVTGIHMNTTLGNMPEGTPTDATGGLSDQEKKDLEKMKEREDTETGYAAIQSTKPQSLGYALNDSPAGLAAWIVEKFHRWSDCDGNVETRFTKDELLTNIMIYWVTQTITSSMRLYYEARASGWKLLPDQKVTVPTGCILSPIEPQLPRKWVEESFNVTHWTVMPSGGHFAALEEPDLLVKDIRAFFRDLR